MEVLHRFLSIMLCEVFFSHWLIHRYIFSINEILSSHLLHSLLLSLLVISNDLAFIGLVLKKIHKSSLVSSFVLNFVVTELKMSLSEIVLHLLVKTALSTFRIQWLICFFTHCCCLQLIPVSYVEVGLLDQLCNLLVFLNLRGHCLLWSKVIMRKRLWWEFYLMLKLPYSYFQLKSQNENVL